MAATSVDGAVAAAQEIKGRARCIRLQAGLNLVRLERSGAASFVIAGFRFPATQILPKPGESVAVTILSNSGGGTGWLGTEGGAVVVKAADDGGSVLAVTYGLSEDAALPAVKVLPLNRLNDIETALPPPVPKLPIPVGRQITGEIVVHIERQGDRRFALGEWAGNPDGALRVEGLAIRPLDTILPGQIEYMGYRSERQQTPWTSNARLCGTRGRGLPLAGFAVRLALSLHERFDVVYEAKFVSGETRGPLRNGEPCLPSAAGDVLSAIRVRIIERPGG